MLPPTEDRRTGDLYRPHTRGDSSVNNKPQAFLLTAPEDHAEREEMIKLLLSMEHGANLCVWDCAQIPDEQQMQRLDGMNLFVLAMTERLARDKQADALRAVKFAYDHMIPLLPVYYISPNTKNEPAGSFFRALSAVLNSGEDHISLDGPRHRAEDFKEQFTRKLRALVISEKIREEILQSAFGRKIFLSYRKDDKARAWEVMNAIHDLPMCESLSIWYDAFLPPGEDFNAEIQQQFTEVDAFVFTVTPLMVKPGNYALDKEYKPAMATGKPVILAEAQETAPESLSNFVPPMREDPIPILDRAALYEAVLRAGLVDKNTKAPTPRQKFLLGMAYRNGNVRTEQNMKRALRLLMESANEGEPDAALELSFMYLARIGVERDNEAALKWRQLAFDNAVKAVQSGKPEALDAAWRAAFGTDGLVLMTYAQDHQADAREICRTVRQLVEASPDSPERDVRLAATYIEEADPHYDDPARLSEEKLKGYAELAQRGVELLEDMDERDNEADYQLAMGYGALADVYGRLGRFNEAEANYKKSIAVVRRLSDETDSIVYRRSHVSLLHALGLLYKSAYRFQEAQEVFKEAIPIAEKIYAERGLPADRESLAYSYSNYGTSAEDFKEGAELLEKAIAFMREEVAEDPQDAHMREILAEMEKALKYQRKKPMLAKLIQFGIIAILGAALLSGVFMILQELLA